jgi:hypothetical protein
LIEELQFKSTHAELQKQLAEQKLVLQQMSQQMADTEHNIAETEQHGILSNYLLILLPPLSPNELSL